MGQISDACDLLRSARYRLMDVSPAVALLNTFGDCQTALIAAGAALSSSGEQYSNQVGAFGQMRETVIALQERMNTLAQWIDHTVDHLGG